MKKDICFVFVSLQRMNTDRESTSTSIAKELSKRFRVLYINPPIDRRTLLTNKEDQFINAHINELHQKEDNLHQVNPNLWMYNPRTIMESINWIPSTNIFSYFNKINNRRFASEIRSAASRIGMERFILVNDKDIFRSYYLKEYLNPDLFVYLYRDYTLAFSYWRRHGEQLEPSLMRKADVIVCNSFGFTELTSKYNDNAHFIGNGCNTDLFNGRKQWEIPGDLKEIPGPVIGYCGALTHKRLDINLLLSVATARPQYSLVLVGTESEQFRKSKLHELPNVFFLGQKETKHLPGYVAHFDVCINPQMVNQLTNDNYPMKIDEYLAMGKPVVATATKTMNELFSGYTYLAENDSSFVTQIDNALLEDTAALKESRIKFAHTHRWANVTDKFLDALELKTGEIGGVGMFSDTNELNQNIFE